MYTKSSNNQKFQIFKDYQDYQSRNVDSPSYEPLKQWILVLSSEEEKRRKRNEYAKEYYRKNRERLREQQREYWKRKHADWNHRWNIIGIQKKVYEYLLNQHCKWEDPSRWTEIARALWIGENSVYTAIFQLTKKWYLWRGTYWRYLLLKFPDSEEFKNEKEVTLEDIKSTHQTLVWKWYLEELADQISSWLVDQNKELYEENQKLKEQLKQIKEAWIEHEKYRKNWNQSYWDLDQIIMNR